jgi:hypothetical protein
LRAITVSLSTIWRARRQGTSSESGPAQPAFRS